MKRRFPVTILSHCIPEKGVHIAKRGPGAKVAWCRIQNGSLSELTVIEDVLRDQIEKAEKTRAQIEKALKLMTPAEAPDNVEIEFLTNHDRLMDLSGGTAIRCDIDIADEMDIAALYTLGLLYGCFSISGADEKAALNAVITFYENLPESDRNSIDKILSQPKLDTGDIFLRFLQNSAHKSQAEKDRLISWVRGRSQVDLPYDDTDVIKALEEETDLAALRLRIYNSINDTYVESVDTGNANRIADVCWERGMRIVAGRFSRALYLDAMLMANAKVIDASHLRKSVDDLEKLIKGAHISAPLQTDFSRIAGEMQMIANLAAEEQVSYAQIEGAILKFKKALREFETYCLDKLDAGHSMLDADILDHLPNLTHCRSEIRDREIGRAHV